jgi:hypothetical protein
MTDTTQPLFTLDDADARRIERLIAERTAIEVEVAMIFKRAVQATDPIRVVFGPPKTAEFIFGGHPVSPYVVTPNGCGIYDLAAGICQQIPCSQVPADATILQP